MWENYFLDWLIGIEGEEDIDYVDFYEFVDMIIMGRKIYEEILVLFFDEFLYKGKECYVFLWILIGCIEDVWFIYEEFVDFI